MDTHKLITRYQEFGGMWLVFEYAKIGALWPAIKAGIRCVIKRQSFKQIYPEALRRVESFLERKYTPMVSSFRFQDSSGLEHKRRKVIWFCWLQGLELAPPIVKACYNSLTRYLNDREIKVIDNDNWREYIECRTLSLRSGKRD